MSKKFFFRPSLRMKKGGPFGPERDHGGRPLDPHDLRGPWVFPDGVQPPRGWLPVLNEFGTQLYFEVVVAHGVVQLWPAWFSPGHFAPPNPFGGLPGSGPGTPPPHEHGDPPTISMPPFEGGGPSVVNPLPYYEGGIFGQSEDIERAETEGYERIEVVNKFLDLYATSGTQLISSNDATTTGTLLNGIVSGPNSYERFAQKVRLLGLDVRGYWQTNGTPTSFTRDYLRMLVVYDRQTNGVAAKWSDVIMYNGGNSSPTSLVFDNLNVGNRSRFIVLKDLSWLTPAYNNATDPVPIGPNTPPTLEVNFSIKFYNLYTDYNYVGGNGTVAQINTGGLSIIVQSRIASQWTIVFSPRLRFCDV